MKLLAFLAWSCFAIEAVLVVLMLTDRGGDAASKGLGAFYAILVGAPMAIAAGLLVWGHTSGRKGPVLVGAAITTLPLTVGLVLGAKGLVRKAARNLSLSKQGRFSDGRLTELARAIDRGDLDRVKALLQGPPPDWKARDAFDRTLLGHAVTRAMDSMEGKDAHVEAVKLLLKAGAPPAEDALRPNDGSYASWYSLLNTVAGDGSPRGLALLDAFLEAGADPDTKAQYDDHPILFAPWMNVAKFEVFARHGANLQAKDGRSDRKGYSLLMNAVVYQSWKEARWLLEHGVSPEVKGEDGATVDSLLKEAEDRGEDPERRALVEGLESRRR
ncbi:MAG: ankyrin repeat domain-containing protein [Holophagaceae bacterium]